MFKKIIKKFLIKYNFFSSKKYDELKISKAKNFFLTVDLNLEKISKIDSLYYKVFSQNGEDGIIQYLIKSLKLKKIKFVEIGTENYAQSNTRYIFEAL